ALSGAFGGGAARRRRSSGGGSGQPGSSFPSDPKSREVGAGMIGGGTVIEGLIREAKADGRWDNDPVLRDRLVQLFITGKVSAWNIQRAAAQRRAGGQPGPEGSISKLFGTEFK